MAAAPSQPRHTPCTIMRDQGIDCLLWFEDALAAYGVPTAVFDLYLLVDDPTEAEHALMAKGWTPAPGPSFSRDSHVLDGLQSIPHRRLDPPRSTTSRNSMDEKLITAFRGHPEPPTTVLLPAANWGIPSLRDAGLLPTGTGEFVPPLALLVDGLVGVLLDLPAAPNAEALQGRLGVQLAYLYRYCAGLKKQDFAQNLKLEHRQFHYDALSKPGLGTMPFVSQQRQNKMEILQGERQPQRNQWYLAPT